MGMMIVHRAFRFLAVLGFLSVIWAAPGRAATVAEMMADQVLGDPKAPITIYEYSSLTCPHCASFANEVLPQLKKTWIDTGKAKLIHRDFPLDNIAAGAAMLARCSGRYYPFIETLFKSQSRWAAPPNPRGQLIGIARLGGMSQQQIDDCMNNQALFKAISDGREAASSQYNITSTPSFVINGKVYKGGLSFDELDRILKAN